MTHPHTWFTVAVLGVGLTVFAQESDQHDSGAPRRPRIRSYNRKADIIPLGDAAPPDRGGRTSGVDPDILRERSTQRDRQYGMSRITGIPMLTPTTPEPTRKDGEETENDNWINPLDLLSEDELYNPGDLMMESDLEDGAADDMEISDWETLQERLIERELENTRGDEEQDEDQADAEEGRRDRSVDMDGETMGRNTGLGLEPLVSRDDATLESEEGDAEVTGRVETGERLLESAMRMVGRRDTPGPRGGMDDFDAPEREELTRSRAMLNEVRDKWRPASGFDRLDRASATSDRTPDMGGRRPEVDRPTLRMEAVSLPPAVTMDRSEPSLPQSSMRGRRAMEGPSSPSLDRGNFRPEENRIRSLLGETP